jgi:predicted branched-subunit amino acid permease
VDDAPWTVPRRVIVRNAIGVGLATGAYGVSFGAVSIAAGFSLMQTVALSLLMFTGASQFALVGVIGSGGSAASAAATAILLGARNSLYGLRLSTLLQARGARRFAAAQFVIDETTAMAVSHEPAEAGRVAFWATGLAVFGLWNLGTVVGAIGADLLADPAVLGLDAAAPAAFIALLAPRLRGREPWAIALVAAIVAVATTPFVPAGVPVLAAAGVALVAGMRR